MKSNFFLFFCCLFTIIELTAQDVPRVISYQGVLVGADGKPVNSTPQNPVKIKFELVNAAGSQIKDLGTESRATVVGGLFTKPLDLNGIQQNELNQQLFLRITVNDGTPYPLVPLYSSVSALNIPDGIVTEQKIAPNVVTSSKIKDGEVKAIDIASDEVVKSIKGLKEAIDIVAGNPNIRIKVDGQNIVIEGKDTVKAAEQLIGGIPSGVPVGTILPYAGSDTTWLASENWILCDGRPVSRTSFSELFTRIGINWGTGDGINTFNIPDLRGQFLRGTDTTSRGRANNDPDFSDRIGTGQKIGSVQGDILGEHNHRFIRPADNCGEMIERTGGNVWCSAGCGKGQGGCLSSSSVEAGLNSGSNQTLFPSGGSETRPKNVYVNYIIKAR